MGGIPHEHILVVVHSRGKQDAEASAAILDLLDRRGVFHEVWEGEALLFSTVAHHWRGP